MLPSMGSQRVIHNRVTAEHEKMEGQVKRENNWFGELGIDINALLNLNR